MPSPSLWPTGVWAARCRLRLSSKTHDSFAYTAYRFASASPFHIHFTLPYRLVHVIMKLSSVIMFPKDVPVLFSTLGIRPADENDNAMEK